MGNDGLEWDELEHELENLRQGNELEHELENFYLFILYSEKEKKCPLFFIIYNNINLSKLPAVL